MKKTLIIPALIFALSFASCKKDSPNEAAQVNNEWSTAASKAFSTCGSWRVELYTVNGNNETTNYGGYQFSFCPDNILSASNDIMTVPGNWYLLLAREGSSYFQIDFKTNDVSRLLEELDGQWVIKGLTEDKITLDSQDNTRRLVFVLVSK